MTDNEEQTRSKDLLGRKIAGINVNQDYTVFNLFWSFTRGPVRIFPVSVTFYKRLRLVSLPAREIIKRVQLNQMNGKLYGKLEN